MKQISFSDSTVVACYFLTMKNKANSRMTEKSSGNIVTVVHRCKIIVGEIWPWYDLDFNGAFCDSHPFIVCLSSIFIPIIACISLALC